MQQPNANIKVTVLTLTTKH